MDNVIERRGYPGTIHRIACKTQFNNVNVIRLDASSRACRFKRVTSYDRRKFTLLHDRPPLPLPPAPSLDRRIMQIPRAFAVYHDSRSPLSLFFSLARLQPEASPARFTVSRETEERFSSRDRRNKIFEIWRRAASNFGFLFAVTVRK